LIANQTQVNFSSRTEFHVNFLWGKKGAMVSAEERHAKFEQVLTVMAEKFCAESA
jgi:SH2 domain-containing protein 3C